MTGSAAAPSGLVAPLTGVAFITGAGSGIGAETVRSFSRAGVRRFALIDVQGDKLKEVAAEFGPDHEVLTAVVDVTNREQVDAFVDETVARFGRLDYAANVAGIGGTLALFDEVTEEQYDRMMNINQRGVYLCMKAEVRVMLKQSPLDGPAGGLRTQRGAIVNVASLAGLEGFPRSSVYVAAKHAVVGLTKSVCADYAAEKIRVNCVAPGLINTPLGNASLTTLGLKSLDDMPNPMKRAGLPQEIADVIVFLASESAGYINGHTIPIDGGSHATV